MVLAVDLFDSGVELSKEGGYLIEEGNGKGIFLFGVVKLESGDVFVLGIESWKADELTELEGKGLLNSSHIYLL